MKLTVLVRSAEGTLHSYWSAGLRCDNLQYLIAGQSNVAHTALNQPLKSLSTSVAHQTWTHNKFRPDNGSK